MFLILLETLKIPIFHDNSEAVEKAPKSDFGNFACYETN